MGYLWQIRSSRRLKTECQRNVEVMWLLGRLVPDYKSIAEFRLMHREACSRQLCSYADKGLQITEEFPLLVSSPAQGLVPSF